MDDAFAGSVEAEELSEMHRDIETMYEQEQVPGPAEPKPEAPEAVPQRRLEQEEQGPGLKL